MIDKNQSRVNKLIVVLSVLLLVSIVFLIWVFFYGNRLKKESLSSVVEDNYISYNEEVESGFVNSKEVKSPNLVENPNIVSEVVNVDKTVKLSLYQRNAEDSIPFNVGNMFPGDRVVKNFNLKVYHEKPVTVRFKTEIQSGYEKFSEVLKCTIKLLPKDTIIYDGLLSEMPESLDTLLNGSSEEDLVYNIDVYLDTSVGNEYQNEELKANFTWWVDEEEKNNLVNPPVTGDSTGVLFYMGIGVGSLLLLCLILLYSRRKERGKDE